MSEYQKKILFLNQTYAVGTQKNWTVLLSIQNVCLNYGQENITNFTLGMFVNLNLKETEESLW